MHYPKLDFLDPFHLDLMQENQTVISTTVDEIYIFFPTDELYPQRLIPLQWNILKYFNNFLNIFMDI